MEDKDLDKLFRDAFIEAEETPRQDLWNSIEAELNDQGKIISIKKKNNWWAYAAAAVLLISFGSYFGTRFYSSEQDENRLEKQHLASIETPQEQMEQSRTPEQVEPLPSKTIEQTNKNLINKGILLGHHKNTQQEIIHDLNGIIYWLCMYIVLIQLF